MGDKEEIEARLLAFKKAAEEDMAMILRARERRRELRKAIKEDIAALKQTITTKVDQNGYHRQHNRRDGVLPGALRRRNVWRFIKSLFVYAKEI